MALFETDRGKIFRTKLKGRPLLEHSILNKGSAFTFEERSHFDLHGLIPAAIETLSQQAARLYQAYKKKTEDPGIKKQLSWRYVWRDERERKGNFHPGLPG